MISNRWQFMPWQRAIARFFLPYLQSDRRNLIILYALRTFSIGANTLLIWMLGVAISQITNAQFDQLNQSLLIIAGIVVVNQGIQLINAYLFQQVTLRFVDRVRGGLLTKIMTLSYPVVNRFDRGDLLARLTADVDRLLTFVINAPLNAFSSTLVLIAYSAMLIWIDWQLALIAATMAPLFFLSQHYVAPRTGAAARQFTQEKAKLLTVEEQTLRNLRGISAFNSETTVREKHQYQFNTARRWALKVRRIRILYNTFFTFLLYIAGVIVVFSGISSIKAGELSIGVLVSFLVYVRNLTGPVRTLARMPVQLQADRHPAERVMDILQSQSSVLDDYPDNPLAVNQGDIAFNNVTFCYPQGQDPVLTNVSVKITAGETMALVGPSGSGKSTFASLLLRFYDPQQGTITIDGTDIKTVSLASLRDQISIVWQEPFIVDGSVRENMLLARPDAGEQQMIDACHAGFAWEFLEKHKGLDTVIGTNGLHLSVGQIQRLAIAQAFLRNTPILILDEASSALDSHSERMIVEALQRLREDRTTLIIAHRFSSIRMASRILYFNGDGTITAGTHNELMEQLKDYERAVTWQGSLA
ncbi:MAG: ABC transporter ATP-binding protein [Gammaproteobacteria bacterium]|jgi:ABC-type multidrug transport system fused ATPase/permease subunit